MPLNISTINDYGLKENYLPQIRAFLRVSSTQDDELIGMLFDAAVNYVEEKLEITIGKKDYILSVQSADFASGASEIFLPRTGLTSVTSIKIGEDNLQYTQSGNYIYMKDIKMNDMIKVQFTCEAHPSEALMLAIFRHVFFLYENRSILNHTNSGSSFETHEIQKLYQAFLPNNFNI